MHRVPQSMEPQNQMALFFDLDQSTPPCGPSHTFNTTLHSERRHSLCMSGIPIYTTMQDRNALLGAAADSCVLFDICVDAVVGKCQPPNAPELTWLQVVLHRAEAPAHMLQAPAREWRRPSNMCRSCRGVCICLVMQTVQRGCWSISPAIRCTSDCTALQSVVHRGAVHPRNAPLAVGQLPGVAVEPGVLGCGRALVRDCAHLPGQQAWPWRTLHPNPRQCRQCLHSRQGIPQPSRGSPLC